MEQFIWSIQIKLIAILMIPSEEFTNCVDYVPISTVGV